jgi:hypothetical protein
LNVAAKDQVVGKITLSPELSAQLNGLTEQRQVCDEKGNTLGHFVPVAFYRELFHSWAQTEFTDTALDRARQETRKHGGLTTPEAIALLEKKIAAATERTP